MKKLILSLSILISSLNYAFTQTAPTTAATAVDISSITVSSLYISCTPGNGTYRLVTIKPVSETSVAIPANASGSTYSPSSNFLATTNSIGTGHKIVYMGTASSSIYVYNLTANTQYRVRIYEYNKSTAGATGAGTYAFNTSTSASVTEYTLTTEPTIGPSNLQTSNVNATSMTISWSIGNGTGNVVIMRPKGEFSYAPKDGSTYVGGNNVYGNGDFIGRYPSIFWPYSEAYVVYVGTGNSVTVTNLQPAVAYDILVYEGNVGATANTVNYLTSSYLIGTQATYNTSPLINGLGNPSYPSLGTHTVCQYSGSITIDINSITPGSESNQTVYLDSIATNSLNTTIIPNNGVTYFSTGVNTGKIVLTPNYGVSGTLGVWVRFRDGAPYDNVTYNPNWNSNRNYTDVYMNIVIKPLPTEPTSLTASVSTVCENGTVTLTASGQTNATKYEWWLYNGINIVNDTTNSPVRPFVAQSGSASYHCYVRTHNGQCPGNWHYPATYIQVDQTPSLSNAGSDQLTCSDAVTLDASPVYVGVGEWKQVVSNSCLLDNVNDNKTSARGLIANTTTKLVWEVSNGACTVSRDTVDITRQSGGACVLDASFTVNQTEQCQLGNYYKFFDNSYVPNPDIITNWNWDFGDGSFDNTSGSVATHVYTAKGTYNVTLTITSSANQSDTYSYNVIIKDVPNNPNTITGVSSLCQGQTAFNGINPIQFSSGGITIGSTEYYNWILPIGFYSNNTYSENLTITVDSNMTVATTTLKVTLNNECGASDTIFHQIIIKQRASAVSAIVGSNTICQGDTAIFYVTPTGNNTIYNWDLPSGYSLLPQNSDSSIVSLALASNASNGSILVTPYNSCGNAYGANLNISVNPLPGAVSSITGEDNISSCAISGTFGYKADTSEFATSYNWILPSNATGSSLTDSIVVTYQPGASGNISVQGVNACGSGTVTSLALNIQEVLPIDICFVSVDTSSTHNVIYWQTPDSLADVDSVVVYRELTNNNFQRIGSATAQSGYYIDNSTNPNVSTGYKYKILSKDACGNTANLNNSLYHRSVFFKLPTQQASMYELEWFDYIVQNNPLAVSYYKVMRDSLGNGVWDSIGTALPGTPIVQLDLANLLATKGRVRIDVQLDTTFQCDIDTNAYAKQRGKRNLGGPSHSNLRKPFMPTAIFTLNNDIKSISIIPNPANNEVRLNYAESFELGTLTIIDALGRVVKSNTIKTSLSNYLISTTDFASGIYTLQLTTDKYRAQEKLIIQH